MPVPEERALKKRRAAAARYKPDRIDLLLIGEAPPSSEDRFFYFEDVREHDSLFRYVCRVLLEREPTRDNKAELLEDLRRRGVFLIDLRETPVDGASSAGLPVRDVRVPFPGSGRQLEFVEAFRRAATA
jgi:hypothetical protein